MRTAYTLLLLPDLLAKNIRVGIVTAAGYTSADRYYQRLHGLLDAIAGSTTLDSTQRQNLIIMGGEANYLFEFSGSSPWLLEPVDRSRWLTPEMAQWSEADISALLDVAEAALRDCIATMRLPAELIRKDRAVGIIPRSPEIRISRESLEETVLVVQRIVELEQQRQRQHQRRASVMGGGGSSASMALPVPFCAFNGGRDVFVDIGDKSWGVAVCQQWFGGIRPEGTLHVGDQFLSAGSNDFKARSVGTTAWIANPAETVELLDELADLMQKKLE